MPWTSSHKYDYTSLSTGLAYQQRNWKSWIWPTCFVALLIADAAFFIFHPRAPISPLDNFQNLNNFPVANVSAVPPLAAARNEYAVVSALYTDAYTTAIVALGHSLRTHNVTARIILMYLPERISARSLCLVSAAGWTLHAVPYIAPPNNGKGISSRFKDQYTKLNLWTLDTIGVNKVVYLDADTLVRKNFDEIFTLPFAFAAVPDVFGGKRGFTIAINAGVLFLQTSSVIYKDMLAKIQVAKYPPNFAEQAFLNLYFGVQAVRLPYAYNANLAIKKRKPEMWEALMDDIRIVHYTLIKPFPMTGDGWLDPQEVEESFERSRTADGGAFAEEMSWWAASWRDLMIRDRVAIERCTS